MMKPNSSLAYRTWPLLMLVLGVPMLVLSGCGGGSHSDAVTQSRTGKATFTIKWPTRSRLIPAASNSVVVEIRSSGTFHAAQTLPRPSGGGSATVTFDFLQVGTLTAVATAYPQADGSGVAQASASTPLVIQAGQTTPFSLTMASTIDHLELASPVNSVSVGGTVQLMATAKDATGAIVLLSAGQLSWQSQDTTRATIDANGLVTALAAGNPTLSVMDNESQKSATLALAIVLPPTPLLYDGFAYPVGQGLANQNGGTGNWGGVWNEYGQGNTSSVIQAGSLQFGRLATSGNAIMTTSDNPVGHARQFATPLTLGTSGTTLFISYLVKPLDALNVGNPSTYYGLAFGGYSLEKDGGSDFYGIGGGSGFGTFTPTTIRAVTNQTVFLVGRFTFRDGNDTCDMWVNPTPGQPLPATPDATATNTDTHTPADFNIGSSIRCLFDEIRFGTTWEQVSPVQ